jgi:hypothetical protein
MSDSESSCQLGKYELREPMQFGEKFELTEAQIRKFDEWAIGVEKRAAALQFEKAKHNGWGFHYPVKLPYYGTIGGGFSFIFTPNGIGMSCKVIEAITGESIDLTDYDNW